MLVALLSSARRLLLVLERPGHGHWNNLSAFNVRKNLIATPREDCSIRRKASATKLTQRKLFVVILRVLQHAQTDLLQVAEARSFDARFHAPARRRGTESPRESR